MMSVESSTDPKLEGRVNSLGWPANLPVRGGWLADEMGMGPSAGSALMYTPVTRRSIRNWIGEVHL
jgi:hypothetical protein